MANTFKTFPWHVFLFPVFFILHVLNAYYGLIPGGTYMVFGFYYLLLSVLLLLLGRLLMRSLSKGGIWATGLLTVFYFFGAFHDLLKGVSFLRPISSYSVVLPVIVVALLTLTFLFRRRKASFLKGQRYLNILFIILTCVEVFSAAYHLITHKEQENNYAQDAVPALPSLPSSAATDPDIFFIVFDEYTSSKALKKYYGYDNSLLDSALLNRHFYVANNASSNYNSTPLSISSCFNLQYFDKPFENEVLSTKQILQSWYTLKRSEVPRLLKAKGYDVHNYGLSDLGDDRPATSRYFSSYESQPLYQETLWGRIGRDIWWHVYEKNIPGLQQRRVKAYTANAQAYIARNARNYELTLAALKEQGDHPRFVFTHIMMPHEPFYLDEQGQLQDEEKAIVQKHNATLYTRQLAYCNQWIDSLARSADQPFSRPRVVIIEGDHGFRDTLFTIREKQFMNLNAYYFSDGDYSQLYDSISPVNSFRLVFNKYFHAGLPLSPDSTILLK